MERRTQPARICKATTAKVDSRAVSPPPAIAMGATASALTPSGGSRQEPRGYATPQSTTSFRSTLSDLKKKSLCTKEKLCQLEADFDEKEGIILEEKDHLMDCLDEDMDPAKEVNVKQKIEKLDGKLKRLRVRYLKQKESLNNLLKAETDLVRHEEDNEQRLDSEDEAVVQKFDASQGQNGAPSPANKVLDKKPEVRATVPSPVETPVTSRQVVISGTPMTRTTAVVPDPIPSDGETAEYSDDGSDNEDRESKVRERQPAQRQSQTSARPPDHQIANQNVDVLSIHGLTAALRDAFGNRGSNLEKRLPEFNGDPSQWGNFSATFRRTTDKLQLDDSENMQRLQAALKGEAKEAVQHLMANVSNVTKIMDILKERFGRPEFVLDFLVEKAKHCKAPDKAKPKTIVDFGTAVQALVTNIEAFDETDYLTNRQLVTELVAKMPQSMKESWYQYLVDDSKRRSNLKYFARWITGQMKVAQMQIRPAILFEKKEDAKPEERRGNDRRTKRGPAVAAAGIGDEKDEFNCPACEKPGHSLPTCYKFKKISVDERWNLIKEKKACIGCLRLPNKDGKGHQIKDCRSAKECSEKDCKRLHHPLLHTDAQKRTEPAEPPQMENQSQSKEEEGVAAYIRGADGPLGVVPIKVRGPKGTKRTFALLDSGATKSYISNSLASDIGLEGKQSMYTVQGMYGKKTTVPVSNVTLEVSGVYPNAKFYKLTDVKSSEKLGFTPYSIDVDALKKRWPHLRRAKMDNLKHAQIEVLIGEEDGFLSCHKQVLMLDENSPVAKRTVLGWFVSGKMPTNDNIGYAFHATGSDDMLHNLIKEHFNVENFGVKVPNERSNLYSIEDKKSMIILENTYKNDQDAPEIGLLYRDANCSFPESRSHALKRLEGIEKKMERNSEFKEMYLAKFKEYKDKNYISEVKPTVHNRLWFIPHFGVTNPNKPGKLRLVFDAAAKSHGVCLNDYLMKGPDLIRPLTEVLYNFRRHRIVINGDIEDMFHRVSIRQQDGYSQRFLWRDGDNLIAPKEFEMNVMIFGAASSPSSAIFVKNRNAQEYIEQYPEAVRAITEDFYVDDVLTGADTVDEATKLFEDITWINERANFAVKKWTSNSIEVLSKIPPEIRAAGAKGVFAKSDIPTERVLGLWWDPASDTFSFRTNFHKVKKEVLQGQRPTKREICSLTMSLFDPLGFLAQFRIKAMILLQQTWRDKIGWDDEVSDKIYEDWKRWIEELQNISQVKVPRCYNANISDSFENILHVFVDASEQAYAAVVYLVTKTQDDTSVSFVAAKARVAPLKKLTIPRMELMAALLGTRLVSTIEQGLKLKVTSRVFWSDSRTVLGWLKNETSRYKEFVANRVGEIQELTNPMEWRWIPTDENVADDATRTNKPTDFNPNCRWFKGPSFLEKDKGEWPKENHDHGIVAAVTAPEKRMDDIIDNKRFSNYNRLIRASAAVIAVNNFLNGSRKDTPWNKVGKNKFMSNLTPEEIELGEMLVLREVQNCFEKEKSALIGGDTRKAKSSCLYKLSPVIDSNGLLRVRGRVGKALVHQAQKQPIIIPAHHHVTNLLVLQEHRKNAHQGDAAVLGNLRQKFWIIGGLNTVKRITRSCAECHLKKVVPVIPEMGNLPHYRLASFQPPFTFTGVDFFGPMEVVVGRHREKRWGVVFVCMVTRAVHLDIAHGLGTDEMMCVFSRFVDTRGMPRHIYSDNGTNFVGAARELREGLANFDQNQLKVHQKFQAMDWHFIPPGSPHMGGAWERMVKTVKKALWNVLKERHPRDQTLLTALKAVENIVNSRPLFPVSEDPTDEEVLTPNHFLRGHNNKGPSIPVALDDSDEFGKRQWKIAQSLANHFWNRWSKEYLPTLLGRNKWYEKGKPIEIGDLVYVVDENAERNQWKRGVIKEVYPGEDGLVRVVDVSTRDWDTKRISTYRRSVAKICPLGLKMDSGLVSPKSGAGMLG